MNIIDRTHKAMGGQSHDRSLSAIKNIAWHYTAVDRELERTIETHERFWKNHHGWSRGGYHYYIDAHGKIFKNYNLTTISNGVRYHNSNTVHISVEANSAGNYSQAQVDARHELTLYLMDKLGIPASNVKQHKEFSRALTSCAGYTKAQMDAFRKQLRKGGKPKVTESKPSKPKRASGSVVDYMNAKGMDSSYSNRKKLAKQYGVSNYRGTAAQNAKLLNKIKSGAKPSGNAWTGQTLSRGARGKAVRQLQQMLADNYYYPNKGAKNHGVDGIYGADTEDAVKRYQSMHGLAVDGIAGRNTYNSLK